MDATQNKTRVKNPSDPAESSEQIKSDIHRTRQRMDRTIDEIGDRLHPRNLMEDLFDMIRNKTRSEDHHIRDALKSTGQTVLTEIKNNPIPSLLIGAGVAWLLFGREDEDTYLVVEEEVDVYGEVPEMEPSGPLPAHYQEQGKEPRSKRLAQSARDKAQEYSEKASSGFSSGVEGIKEKAAQGGEAMRSAAQRAKQGFSEQGRHLKERGAEVGSELKHQIEDAYEVTWRKVSETADEHPMAAGLGLLALGVIAGLALPRTRSEDELVGDLSQELKEKAQHAGEEVLERGKRVARATADAVSKEAEAQGLTPEHLKEKVTATAEQAKAAATQSGRQQQVDPGNLKDKAQAVVAKGKETAEQEIRHQKEESKGTTTMPPYSGSKGS
jgi:hypothetical protein